MEECIFCRTLISSDNWKSYPDPIYTEESNLFCCDECYTDWLTEFQLASSKRDKVKLFLESKFAELSNLSVYGGFKCGVLASFYLPGFTDKVGYSSSVVSKFLVSEKDKGLWIQRYGEP